MARPQTRDEAATMAREAFTPEVWAAMQRIAEKRPEWAALWGALPRGHVAALAILEQLERALPLLREASRLAVEARAPVYEAAATDTLTLIPGDLDRLCSVVFDLTRSVPAAERAVAEVRPRVERARKRDEFNAKRFRRHESAADARASRELFITAVLEHFPDITRSEHAWGCVAVALGFAARGDWDKGTWESTKKSWAAEVRRLVKARRPR